jgi:hypothetical protein
MIWIVIGLLVAGIVAFFVYLFVVRWGRLERHGSVAVPGESVLELPAGELVLYYQDSRKWRYSQRPEPPTGFSVVVSDERSGERVDLGAAPDTAIYKARGKNRIPHATLRLPRAGRYLVRSHLDGDAIEPRITFG